MSSNPSTRHSEIEAITLTEEEIKKAIWTAKIIKWNEERNKEYWKELESLKPKDNESEEFSKDKKDAKADKAVPHLVEKRSKKGWYKAYQAKGH